MENTFSTGLESTLDPTKTKEIYEAYRMEWIISSSLAVPFAVFALYITGTQIVFLTLKKWEGNKFRLPSVTERGTSGSFKIRRGNSNVRFASAITALCIFASLTAFLRTIDLRFFFYNHHLNDFVCDFFIKYKVVMYTMSVSTVYAVLWLRQKIFYEDPRLNHVSSKCIRGFSYFMGFWLVINCILTSSLFIASSNDKGSDVGCVSANEESTIRKIIRWVVMGVSTPISQVVLLGLFIYPLVKHYRTVKQETMTSIRENPVIRLVKRAAVTAIICIVTDAVNIVVGSVIRGGSATILIYDVNIVLNVVCLIISFPDWRERLMPWKMMQEKIPVKQDDSSSKSGIGICSEV